MKAKQATSVRWIAAALLAIGVATSCENSKTITGPVAPIPTSPRTIPTPTPTPAPPAGNIAGDWIGTFDSADPVDCDSNTPAQATLAQDGATVTGILNATNNFCGFAGVAFQGMYRGGTLVGTVTGDRFQNGTATGTSSGTTLEITLTNGSGAIPGGQMHLHR